MKFNKKKILIPMLGLFLVTGVIGSAFMVYNNSIKKGSSTTINLSGTMIYLQEDGTAVSFGLDKKEELSKKELSPYDKSSLVKNSKNGIIVIDNKNKKNTLIKVDEAQQVIFEDIYYPKNLEKITQIEIGESNLVYFDSKLNMIEIVNSKDNSIEKSFALKNRAVIRLSESGVLYYSEGNNLFAYDIKSSSTTKSQNLKSEITNIGLLKESIYVSTKYGESVKNSIMFEFDQNLKAINLHETNMTNINFIGESEDAIYIEGLTAGNNSIKRFQGLPASTQILNKNNEDISIFSKGKIYNISNILSVIDTESLASEGFEISVRMVH